jgi:hypothetical protein
LKTLPGNSSIQPIHQLPSCQITTLFCKISKAGQAISQNPNPDEPEPNKGNREYARINANEKY